MSAAENLAPSSADALSWAKICLLHPNEWVCLLDLDREPDGSFRSGRVIAHDASAARALDQIGTSNPDATLVHTAGRPMQTPRMEIIDESRDLLRSRR